jgi:serine/threonine protein kinase
VQRRLTDATPAQVLDSMMDLKQKEAIFDSPKTMNKHQKNLSKSGGLMVVGNYRLGDTIGKGRYSVVKLATHVLTNEYVALKIVAKNKLSREDMRVLQR